MCIGKTSNSSGLFRLISQFFRPAHLFSKYQVPTYSTLRPLVHHDASEAFLKPPGSYSGGRMGHSTAGQVDFLAPRPFSMHIMCLFACETEITELLNSKCCGSREQHLDSFHILMVLICLLLANSQSFLYSMLTQTYICFARF